MLEAIGPKSNLASKQNKDQDQNTNFKIRIVRSLKS